MTKPVTSAYERMAGDTCPAFKWVGQPFSSCDECGKPFWKHSHDTRYDAPFGGRERRVVITRVQAEACRRKWDR